jgi:AcrR family transcriptional regulator
VRADARRNRERLLDAAETVFTEKGTGASTEEVARQAGVGIGTVFRHFPTKEALLSAVYARLLDGLTRTARDLAGDEDPGRAFFGFVALVVGRSSTKNTFADALTEAGVALPHGGAGDDHPLGDALRTLLARAQAAGAVRADLTPADLRAVLIGVSRALEHVPRDEAARDRLTETLLAGLHA